MNVFVLLNSKIDILKNVNRAKQSSSGATLTCIIFFFPTMEVNGAPKQPDYKRSSEYLPLCSAEQTQSYRFGTTGFVFIFIGFFLFIYYFICITDMIRDMKCAFFPEYLHKCKCNIDFIQQFNKQAVSIK